MIALIRDILKLLGRHAGVVLTYLGIVVGVGIFTALFLSYQTGRPDFCSSCHFMDPYVRHWESSTHSDVSCDQCHQYGVVELTVSIFKYITGTYSTRPKANVHDESCLASDCHDTELLRDMREFGRGIMFDHTVHLEKPLRGEQLRCTSCHNQIVQFEDESRLTHMTVNDQACFVCHFKDAGQGEAITGCDACHGMPEESVEYAGFTFEHGPYLKLGVECKQCHTKIVVGDGAVPENRCYACHIERDRQETDRERLHAIHVTSGGIDCFKCHSDIQHGNYEMVSALEIQCESCHLRQHNKPKQIYMGIGGSDTPDMPSTMFLAQVSCAGCHTNIRSEGEIAAGQSRKEAERTACVVCHGSGYERMFDNWLSGSRKVLQQYQTYLARSRENLNSIGGSKKSRASARYALSSAEHNFLFVREGHISHNIQYSLAMLNASADSLDAAARILNKEYQPPDRGAALHPESSCLTFCHTGLQPPEVVDHQGDELPHRLHIEDMELSCASCHPPSQHGQTAINQGICTDCH